MRKALHLMLVFLLAAAIPWPAGDTASTPERHVQHGEATWSAAHVRHAAPLFLPSRTSTDVGYEYKPMPIWPMIAVTGAHDKANDHQGVLTHAHAGLTPMRASLLSLHCQLTV